MAYKNTYRVKNWREYNRSLINRGNLTVWICEEAILKWTADGDSGKRGRPQKYSDLAIETILTIRSVLRLPLRQVQGFFEGMTLQMGLKIIIPDYSTLSRRAASLSIDLRALPSKEPINLVIDATGLKVFGEGEWHMRTHGKSKRRAWRKFHVAIDANSLEFVAVELTASNVADCKKTNDLLSQSPRVKSVAADKGYDNCHGYGPIADKGARALIPPRSGAALKTKNITWGDVERNRIILEQRFIGKKLWRTTSGYSRRSLVENGIGRYKKILGATMHSREMERQKTEVRIGAKILNQMTQLGMPESYKV